MASKSNEVDHPTRDEMSEPSVHVVMGDPLLSRAAEIYRQNLADAGVEGAELACRR